MCLTSIFLIIHSCLIIQAKPHLFLSLILLLADFRGYQNRLEGLLKLRLLDPTQNFWCRRSGMGPRILHFSQIHRWCQCYWSLNHQWEPRSEHSSKWAVLLLCAFWMCCTLNMSCTYIKLMWKKFKSREQIFFSVSFYVPGLKS